MGVGENTVILGLWDILLPSNLAFVGNDKIFTNAGADAESE